MLNKYIVATCDYTHEAWAQHWNNFPYELDWLYHTEKQHDEEPNTIFYSEQQLRDELDFRGDVSKYHYWNSQGNRNIIWFYAHFRMMYYYNRFPNADYYYFFDDDVKCDNWEEFLGGFKDNSADFISWFVHQKEDYKQHIPTIDKDTTSQHMWFERFPGDNDILPEGITEWYGSFFPIVRISNKAMKTLHKQLSLGYHGWHEGFVPTILNKEGYTMESLYQKDGSSNIYDVNKIDVKHKHANIRWDWI